MSIKKDSLVSVVISSYQSADTLSRAICSVLNQTYSNLEVVVVDNGSTDHTDQVIADLVRLDNRVHPVRLEENRRPAGGRNAGVENSKGDYIAFLDADDEWLPDKLAYQVWALHNHSQAGVVITDGWIIDTITGAKRLYSETYSDYLQRLSFVQMEPDNKLFWLDGPVRETIYEKCFINTSSILLRKSLFQASGGFDFRRFGPEDMDLWVRLAKRARFVYLCQPVVNRFVSANSLSAVSERWLIELLSYHLDCYSSPEYADLMTLVKRNIEKYFRLLVIYYGRERQVKNAWKMALDSLRFGLYPLLFLYASLSIFGTKGYDLGLGLKDVFVKKTV